MRPDPEPGTGDQQRDLSADGVQQDPLPEISNQRGTDPEPGQPARIRNAGNSDQDTGSGSSCGRILSRRSAAMQPDPEPGTGDQQRDPSADGVRQDPLPEIGSHATGSGNRNFDKNSGQKRHQKILQNYYKAIKSCNK